MGVARRARPAVSERSGGAALVTRGRRRLGAKGLGVEFVGHAVRRSTIHPEDATEVTVSPGDVPAVRVAPAEVAPVMASESDAYAATRSPELARA
jgi:hypothetical protein